MDASAELALEDVVDQAVPFDAAETAELSRPHARLEVVPVPGDLGLGAGERGLDAFSELVVRRHPCERVARREHRLPGSRPPSWPPLHFLKHWTGRLVPTPTESRS